MPRNKKALTATRQHNQQMNQAALEKQNGYLKGEVDKYRNLSEKQEGEIQSLKATLKAKEEAAPQA